MGTRKHTQPNAYYLMGKSLLTLGKIAVELKGNGDLMGFSSIDLALLNIGKQFYALCLVCLIQRLKTLRVPYQVLHQTSFPFVYPREYRIERSMTFLWNRFSTIEIGSQSDKKYSKKRLVIIEKEDARIKNKTKAKLQKKSMVYI